MKRRIITPQEMLNENFGDMTFTKNEFTKSHELNESFQPELEARLDTQVISVLNEQIVNELASSQIYRAMSCWLDDQGWVNAPVYFFNAADEELNHMRKIYRYLFSKNCLAEVREVSAPIAKFNDIRDLLNKSLEHEMQVTKNWEDIAELSKQKGDNTTYEFAQWFIKEQIEEEEKFRDFLDKLNLDLPKWKLDECFGTFGV